MSRLESVTATNSGGSLSFSEAFAKALEYIDDSAEAKRKGGVVGVPTGLPEIDARTGGLQQRRLIILAARPSIGKTMLANQIALMAASKGFPVGICSLEMGAEELTIRAMANRYRLNASALSFGDEGELTKLSRAIGDKSIADLPIHLDTDTTSLGGIQARLSEWKRQHDISLGIVDHIGLVEGGDNKSRNDWLGTVSRTLKVTAKRLNIPILAVSQLNRTVEKEKRRPVLSDLRDSGNVEQDCDIALFLHVEPDAVPGVNGTPMEIGLLKNRMGRRGWINERFAFDGRTQTIREVVR
jgi:replicative DNA helicase